MAWRLHEHVLRGGIDNRSRGRVLGQIWLAGVTEPLVLDLRGDCYPDLAGSLLRFENPQPVPLTTRPPNLRQRGTAGDITAARKVRVFDIPFEDAYRMIKVGGKPPEHMANSLYLEWYSNLSGRVVIESTEYQLEISAPMWRFTAEELAERDRQVETASANAFAIEVHADGTQEIWDEFRCEELLRESDARTEKYRVLLEKHHDDPDAERIIAHEMGWTWLEKALDEEKLKPAPSEAIDDESGWVRDLVSAEINLPDPDPAREGIDWLRNEHGDIVHPIEQHASQVVHRLLDELHAAGDPENHHDSLAKFVNHAMTLTAKLAGALGSVAHGWEESDFGLTIAFLKRALDVLHQALAAAEAIDDKSPFSNERIVHYRNELFQIREEVLVLIAGLRQR